MSENKFPIADAHCDFLYCMEYDGWTINNKSDNQAVYMDAMKRGNVKMQFFAAWIDQDIRISPLQQCLNLINNYYMMLDDNDSIVPFSKDFDEKSDKIAAVLTVEGGEAINGQLTNIDILHRLGVRAMTLTWNYTNELAYPAMRRGNKGLTSLGIQTVERMNEVGIALDVSHLNDAGIDDALKISQRPIFASHSNARKVYEHKRSLKDEHIYAIAKQDGVIGVNFYSKQLNGTNSASIDDVIDHIDHIVKIGGIDHVCFGSDFDGMPEYPEKIRDSSAYPGIIARMKERGYSDEDIAKIAYYNLKNYILKFY